MHQTDKGFSRFVVLFLDVAFDPSKQIFIAGIISLNQHVGGLYDHDDVIVLKENGRFLHDFAHSFFLSF